ncbi:MAG: hypothetical protein KatS3mg115_0191 [Candidatus Poribacteria bacterium]|nr:MAG: hypothetical protein KatS3mg115_0191 [Candidatus Poribacteria bacterium]
MPARLLLVDDNAETCRYLSQWLTIELGDAVQVTTCLDRDSALEALRQQDPAFEIVVADLWLPDRSGARDVEGGIRILEEAQRQTPPPEVIIITGNSSADSALRASLTGAREYLVKPVDADRLVQLVREVIEERRQTPPEPVPSTEPEPEEAMIGTSPAMIEVMKALGRIAPTDADVLILGESGAGKELVARTLHANSRRADRPFVVVNCNAIPRELIEAELFGIERRVATEVDSRPGKFMEG